MTMQKANSNGKHTAKKNTQRRKRKRKNNTQNTNKRMVCMWMYISGLEASKSFQFQAYTPKQIACTSKAVLLFNYNYIFIQKKNSRSGSVSERKHMYLIEFKASAIAPSIQQSRCNYSYRAVAAALLRSVGWLVTDMYSRLHSAFVSLDLI